MCIRDSAYTGFLEENKSFDIKKNILIHTEFSPKIESAPKNPEFIKYQKNMIFNSEISRGLMGENIFGDNGGSDETGGFSLKSESFVSVPVTSPFGRFKTGLVPAPVDLRHLSNHHQHSNRLHYSYRFHSNNSSLANITAPAYYDLRSLKKVSQSIKDQGTSGTCWAFATYESLESFLMPRENWDFGDSTYSTIQNPFHVYIKAGQYIVILKVTNKAGSNIVKKTVLIYQN